MRIVDIMVSYIKNPLKIIRAMCTRRILNWLPDRPYLKLFYLAETGKKLNLNKPITFNEKIQWLKLYERKPEYSIYVDKYAVRSYIAKTIGDTYLIPLLGVYNSVEEINWDLLPNKFVLKCTHSSGANIICTDKNKLDIQASKMKLNKWMKRSWYWFGREWSYKKVKSRIICEEYMVDESGTELKDYKIFCFSGVPKMIQVDFNRFVEHKRNLYDIEWNYINASIQYPNDPRVKIKKPDRLKTMLELAKILSKDCSHVRVDFYLINEQMYFGELTFYHGSGYEKFDPESLGIEMGNWIKLPIKSRHFGNMSHEEEE